MNMSLPFACWLPPGQAVILPCQIRTDAVSARDLPTSANADQNRLIAGQMWYCWPRIKLTNPDSEAVEDQPWRDCRLWTCACEQVETEKVFQRFASSAQDGERSLTESSSPPYLWRVLARQEALSLVILKRLDRGKG